MYQNMCELVGFGGVAPDAINSRHTTALSSVIRLNNLNQENKRYTADDIHANKLSNKERMIAASKSLACLLVAVITLLYGVVFATNLSTLLNPVNTVLNILIAVICYGSVAVVFIFLWHQFSRLMTQAFSGFKD